MFKFFSCGAYLELIREFDLIGSSDPYLPEAADLDIAEVSYCCNIWCVC